MLGSWYSAGGFALEKVGGRKVMGAILLLSLLPQTMANLKELHSGQHLQ